MKVQELNKNPSEWVGKTVELDGILIVTGNEVLFSDKKYRKARRRDFMPVEQEGILRQAVWEFGTRVGSHIGLNDPGRIVGKVGWSKETPGAPAIVEVVELEVDFDDEWRAMTFKELPPEELTPEQREEIIRIFERSFHPDETRKKPGAK